MCPISTTNITQIQIVNVHYQVHSIFFKGLVHYLCSPHYTHLLKTYQNSQASRATSSSESLLACRINSVTFLRCGCSFNIQCQIQYVKGISKLIRVKAKIVYIIRKIAGKQENGEVWSTSYITSLITNIYQVRAGKKSLIDSKRNTPPELMGELQ